MRNFYLHAYPWNNQRYAPFQHPGHELAWHWIYKGKVDPPMRYKKCFSFKNYFSLIIWQINKNKNPFIRAKALEALVLYCYFDMNEAKKYIILLFHVSLCILTLLITKGVKKWSRSPSVNSSEGNFWSSTYSRGAESYRNWTICRRWGSNTNYFYQ